MPLKNIPFRGNFNFLGLPEADADYKTARAAILPVPYDGTTSFRAGTRDGPFSIITASRNVELFDRELGCEPLNYGVHTLPELEPDMRGPQFMVERTEKAFEAMVKGNFRLCWVANTVFPAGRQGFSKKNMAGTFAFFSLTPTPI